MKKLLFFFILTSFVNSWAQSPTPPPLGCRVFTTLDTDNDGFATFDINQYLTQFRAEALTLNYDLSGYSFELYPSQADYNAGTNVIVSPYNNIVAFEQFCYMKFIYSGTGPFYDAAELAMAFECHKLETSANLSLDMAIKKPLKFYPNPTVGSLNFDEPIKNMALFTTDARQIQIKIQNQSIDFSNLSSGIYLIQGQDSSGEVFIQKIIKQ
ncbi:T9SS type A sorting domain-containing protein [Flavobacterium sp. CYK-55]|uniref:T9SS type A sorting domain-containing protein n=1 Tax=Flavobacterium sp. CYK-55 TaxID=2835529 RepID=UPI001BD03112|nr:T9SS type A sorting domain-containing protein [Flavobacterium sp. CYK-55]MBS7787450.1 T9SS type A sorting domain-containing protein [Flavobacterium sp. CYK-55]